MHKLYLQENLPYLNVKRCPVCNELVDVKAEQCPNCTHSFKIIKKVVVQRKVAVPPKKEEKPEYQNLDNYSKEQNIPVSEPKKEPAQPVKPEPSNVKPSNEDVNSQTIDTKKKDKKEKKKKKVDEFVELKDIVNMGRKRFFLILQLLLVSCLLVIMLFMPILTKSSFVESIKTLFHRDGTETVMSGMDYFKVLINTTFNDMTVLTKYVTINDHIIFSDVSIISNILTKISEGEALRVYVAFALMLVVYTYIFITLLIIYISSIVGLFRRTPYRAKTVGALLWALLIGCASIYINRFSGLFTGCDSWLIYGFAVMFVYWFLVKLIFGKEARKYKRTKVNLETDSIFEHVTINKK